MHFLIYSLQIPKMFARDLIQLEYHGAEQNAQHRIREVLCRRYDEANCKSWSWYYLLAALIYILLKLLLVPGFWSKEICIGVLHRVTLQFQHLLCTLGTRERERTVQGDLVVAAVDEVPRAKAVSWWLRTPLYWCEMNGSYEYILVISWYVY